eukprot:XP_025014191.1 receptor-like protein EIX2 [Ricinus communis]
MGQNIVLRVGSSWVPPLQLSYLGLGSWHVGPRFLSGFHYLDLSQNQIHGVIPNIPFLDDFNSLIDLSSNNFSGPLPYFSSNLDCWMNWPYLVAVKLNNNRFHGNIPKSIGTLSLLESLHIRNNNLFGEVPISLRDCTGLITLDLSENKLAGNIPTWIGENYSSLNILSLRANEFYGHIPEELCRVASLHILDLVGNNLSGTIPSCFNSFTTMVKVNDSIGQVYLRSNYSGSFLENAFLVIKGKMVKYNTTLRFVRAIDLSHNNLSGEIPVEITNLAGLLSLNLSHNALTGRIPSDIGAMQSSESIDFSRNHLSDEIPKSISRPETLTTQYYLLVPEFIVQYISIRPLHSIPISISTCLIQTSSLAVDAMARYSASALDLVITDCFLLFQVTKFPPTKVQNPEVNFLSQLPAQSASEKPTIVLALLLFFIQIPWPGEPLRYLRILSIASK